MEYSSGSVIAPLIAAEIIRRNRPVVIVATGSTTSAVETDNTIKTLQTFQGMASSGKTRGKAIPIIYLENSHNGAGISYMGTRVENDVATEEVIRQLAVLFAGNHRELDYTDLTNFLDYSKTSPDIRPQLVEMMIFKGNEGLDAHRGVTITTASILGSDEDEPPLLDQPYSAVGYYSEQMINDTDIPNHHFILTAARIPQIFRSLEETALQYRAAKEALMSADLSGMSSASDDDSGMIF